MGNWWSGTSTGFETDVFDNYRDAVKRCNRDSVKALSIISVVTSTITIVFGLAAKQKMAGLYGPEPAAGRSCRPGTDDCVYTVS